MSYIIINLHLKRINEIEKLLKKTNSNQLRLLLEIEKSELEQNIAYLKGELK